eukprot:3571250-Rhodomonas_salina.2
MGPQKRDRERARARARARGFRERAREREIEFEFETERSRPRPRPRECAHLGDHRPLGAVELLIREPILEQVSQHLLDLRYTPLDLVPMHIAAHVRPGRRASATHVSSGQCDVTTGGDCNVSARIPTSHCLFQDIADCRSGSASAKSKGNQHVCRYRLYQEGEGKSIDCAEWSTAYASTGHRVANTWLHSLRLHRTSHSKALLHSVCRYRTSPGLA